MTNLEMSESISRTEFEIATLQAQIDQLQERHDLLKAAEAMRGSVLWQLEQAIEILNQVSPNQVMVFKSEIEAKFENPELIASETAKVIPVPNVSSFQQQQLRLQSASQILSGLVVGQDILWTHDPDACGTYEEVVDTAVKYADLLLKKNTEAADRL